MPSDATHSKLALVTGAGVRLGRASAVRLAQAGYDLLIHYHSSQESARETASLVEAAGRRAWLLQADLSALEGAEALAARISKQHHGLDLLVNNAAVFYGSPTPEDWLEHWDHFQLVNLKSPFVLTVKLLPLLRQRRGNVVNIVDIWARYPLKRFLPYSVAKSGLEALTRALALELAPEVRVNGVSPGAALPASGSEGPIDKMLTQVPLRRLGGAEAIAEAVEFLARADYITGQILAVDGGRTINL
jgi:pteridine reductase